MNDCLPLSGLNSTFIAETDSGYYTQNKLYLLDSLFAELHKLAP